MIDVQQRALGTLKQNRPAGCARLGQKQRHIGDPGPHPLAVCHQLVEQRAPVKRRLLDQAVPGLHVLANVHFERRGIGQVAHPDAPSPYLVLISRANAARGRADLPFATPGFGQHVELAVVGRMRWASLMTSLCSRHNQVGGLFDFGKQGLGSRNAVADDARDDGCRIPTAAGAE